MGVSYRQAERIKPRHNVASRFQQKWNKDLNLSTMKCPHRGHDLRTCPVVNGVIECPLHGLVFDAKTGKNLGYEAALNHQCFNHETT